MTEYKPREGSVAEKALIALMDGPMWSGELASAIDTTTNMLNGSLGPALKYGALAQLAHEGSDKRLWFLPHQADEAREILRKKDGADAPAAPLLTPGRQKPVERRGRKTKSAPPVARAKAAKTKHPKVVAAKRKRRTSTSLPVAVMVDDRTPPSAEQIAVTEAGELVVLKDDRVTHRLPAELVQRIATVATRLQARRA